jgi:hypothetical protein
VSEPSLAVDDCTVDTEFLDSVARFNDDVDDVAFPGMAEPLLEFWASADEYWDAVDGGPDRPY